MAPHPPYRFSDELAQWGPHAPARPVPSLEEAQAYTRRLAESHYENFPVVSMLLPVKLRPHFRNVYAFCRWADDLGDEIDNPSTALAHLDWWRHELDECFDVEKECRHPVFVALRETISQFQLPRAPFSDLISAFETDQTVTHYDTIEQLLEYCQLSANPVGRIVLLLCGADSPRTRELSDAVCTGLQLANMWQDVARDADMGRTYLPAVDRTRFGYSENDLYDRVTNPPFLSLMAHEVAYARSLLEQGLPLADLMPGRLRVDIELFAQGGLAILRKIESIDHRVWETRPKLTRWDLTTLVVRVLWRRSTAWFRPSPSPGDTNALASRTLLNPPARPPVMEDRECTSH